MGISNAMYTGISGLRSNSDGMSVIANNIANANTRAFKTDRAEFEDLMSVSLNEHSQIGRGSRLQAVSTQYTQGALTSTEGLTDLSIQGDGFFIVKNGAADQDSSGSLYTRVGSFRFNKEGFLSDVNGGRVQGYMAQKDGSLSPATSDLEIVTNSIAPKETNQVTLNVNLDARATAAPKFDINKPSATSNHASTVTVYDGMGRGHLSTVYFSKTSDEGVNKWTWNATVDSREIQDGLETGPDGEPLPAIIASGEVEFDADGKMKLEYLNKEGKPTGIDTMDLSDATDIQFNNGARPQKLQFNFGPLLDENGRPGQQTSTSIASNSSTFFHSQNGFETGQLKTLRIENDGTIRGVYTNGLERRIGALALASFKNNNGLQKAGQNYFMASNKSGEAQTGQPQSGQRGQINSYSLEESNVDLAKQFVDMITTQRAFQANSKSITTTDTLLEEVINLKR